MLKFSPLGEDPTGFSEMPAKPFCKKNASHLQYLLLMVQNPAPVDMENIPLFTWSYRSQVVQDFSHQQ